LNSYDNGEILQQNSGNLWRGKSRPAGGLAPAADTSTVSAARNAFPDDTFVLAGSNGAITDANGVHSTISSTD
jgi:hypothetical protein